MIILAIMAALSGIPYGDPVIHKGVVPLSTKEAHKTNASIYLHQQEGIWNVAEAHHFRDGSFDVRLVRPNQRLCLTYEPNVPGTHGRCTPAYKTLFAVRPLSNLVGRRIRLVYVAPSKRLPYDRYTQQEMLKPFLLLKEEPHGR